MENNYAETIAILRKEIKSRDSDIQKAAIFGKQLLEDKEKLNEKLHQILSENEALKQEKYSLQLDLETQVQTVNTQSSELEIRNEQFDNIKSKLELLQKESNSQKQQIENLKHEKEDLEKSVQEAHHEKSELKKKIACQHQQIEQQKAERSLNVSLPQNLTEENDINYYKLQNKQLQEALSEIQFELKAAKLEENRLSNLVKQLEEEVEDRNKEIKSFAAERKKSRETAAELQCEIEMLKLEQLDVNRRGNSVFGELDDRRKLVEKEYKLLLNKYDNMVVNFKNNQRELTNCKGQMAILLSMTSRNYQNAYINTLEDNIMEKKREIENLNANLRKLIRNQRPSCLELYKGGDEYGYLKVLYEQSEKKVKSLENDIVTLHMKNTNDNNALTDAERYLYHTQEELNDMKIENMQLKQQLKELTVKPDDPGTPKGKRRIEILPGYNVTSEMIEKVKAGLFDKKTCDEHIIPGELLLVDGEFREVKPPRRTNRAILGLVNRKVEEDDGLLRFEEDSNEEIAEIKYIKDNSEEKQQKENNGPSYSLYNLSKRKNKFDSNCTHQ